MRRQLLSIFLMVLAYSGCGQLNHPQENQVANITQRLSKNSSLRTPDTPNTSVSPQKRKYIDCWSGMRGGKLEITNEQIFDLNQSESAAFNIILHKEKTGENYDELEEYLLQADYDFPIGFLDKFIKIKLKTDDYGNDDLAFISSYDTYENYQKDKVSGEGTFGRIDCDELKASD